MTNLGCFHSVRPMRWFFGKSKQLNLHTRLTWKSFEARKKVNDVNRLFSSDWPTEQCKNSFQTEQYLPIIWIQFSFDSTFHTFSVMSHMRVHIEMAHAIPAVGQQLGKERKQQPPENILKLRNLGTACSKRLNVRDFIFLSRIEVFFSILG